MTYYKLFMSPILQDGRMLAHLPERLVPVETPKFNGLIVYGPELKGTGTCLFGAWISDGGTFLGWMRTRPNFAEEVHEAVFAIGEVLGRSVFRTEESTSCDLYDAMELFRRALQGAAVDMEA